MRYNSGIQRLEKDPRYQDAKEILWSILNHETPSDLRLNVVFGPAKVSYARVLIEDFLVVRPSRKPRVHDLNAPMEIGSKRKELETNSFYQESQLQLLQWKVPDAVLMEHLYGEYASVVLRIFELFLDSRLQRKCGIPTVGHLNRVGSLAGAMGLDEKTSRRYSAIAALHDCIEDLLNKVPYKRGKPYGLQGYEAFVDSFIPPELQSSVILLTNHYDLILNYIQSALARTDHALTKKTLLRSLEQMMQRDFQPLQPFIQPMHSLVMKLDAEQDFFTSIKWELYKDKYIHHMADTTEEMKNYRTYEIKAIDLSDNAHGRDALAMSGRTKNLIKMEIWARKGYALKSSWGPLNDHIRELEEDALVHAEHMIIRDFLEHASALDFLSSALMKIRDLTPVFFVDEAV